MQVRDLGEQGLLKRLQAFCPSHVVGDDAALVSISESHKLVVTTDVLVDGVHFSWGLATPAVHTTSPYDAGWRAAAANLSDIAAMGAMPLGITVGLALPPGLLVADLDEFYQGLQDCLSQFQTPIVGGDVCRSSLMTVAIAAYGQVLPGNAIYRASAQPGDVIWVTGFHGSSRAGLELLLKPELAISVDSESHSYLIEAHQRPQPRLDVISIIDQVCQSNSPDMQKGRIAGMDSSDGLADAVLQICRASQVGAVLDRLAIPIAPEVLTWRSPCQSLHWALYGGEDFELVLCCEEAIAQSLIKVLDSPARIIGKVTETTNVVLTDPSGKLPDEILEFEHGFQHF
ncbi:MAG: thiamine-phosphate kinase [Cyanobacteria bacterium P01_F01_bin.150]